MLQDPQVWENASVVNTTEMPLAIHISFPDVSDDGGALHIFEHNRRLDAAIEFPMSPAISPLANPRPQWFAAFTLCHHENRVARQLQERNVEHFLPTYEKFSQWRDRRVKLKQPLFPGYLFVRVSGTQRKDVLSARGVVSLVGPPGKPAEVQPDEIWKLQTAIKNGSVEPIDYLRIGERVRILDGPLRGLSGILHRKSNKVRVLISVEAIMRSYLVEVDQAVLEKERP